MYIILFYLKNCFQVTTRGYYYSFIMISVMLTTFNSALAKFNILNKSGEVAKNEGQTAKEYIISRGIDIKK